MSGRGYVRTRGDHPLWIDFDFELARRSARAVRACRRTPRPRRPLAGLLPLPFSTAVSKPRPLSSMVSCTVPSAAGPTTTLTEVASRACLGDVGSGLLHDAVDRGALLVGQRVEVDVGAAQEVGRDAELLAPFEYVDWRARVLRPSSLIEAGRSSRDDAVPAILPISSMRSRSVRMRLRPASLYWISSPFSSSSARGQRLAGLVMQLAARRSRSSSAPASACGADRRAPTPRPTAVPRPARAAWCR